MLDLPELLGPKKTVRGARSIGPALEVLDSKPAQHRPSLSRGTAIHSHDLITLTTPVTWQGRLSLHSLDKFGSISDILRMQNSKETLRGTLNLRIGDKLEAEIERIAALKGTTASETARTLLAYGVEVERRLEAQQLMRHHESELDDDVAGRIVISAEFVPYTWREVAEMQDDLEEQSVGRPGRLPTWDDIQP